MTNAPAPVLAGGQTTERAAPPFWRRLLGFARRRPWKRTVVLALRFLVNPILTRRWWRFVDAFATARGLPPPHDALLQPSLVIFLTRRVTPTDRLGLLMQHFRVAVRILAPDIVRRLWLGDTIRLGDIAGKRGAYRIELLLACRCGGRHEGIFAIRLLRLCDNLQLCTTKFVFVPGPLGPTVVVGGLQGGRNAKRAVIEASRDLGGLRPKEASLLVLQGLLAGSPCPYLFGVAHANHPSTTRHRRRRDRLHADMDGFWRERGGVAEPRFGFMLPHSRLGNGATRRDATKAAFFALGARQSRVDRTHEKTAPLDPSDAV